MLRYSRYLVVALLGCSLSFSITANSQQQTLIEQAFQQTEAGDLEAAQTLLEEAIKEAPSSSLAYTRLGGVLLLQQSYSSGIENFQQAIMLDQSNTQAFIGLAVAYLHLGRYQLAREALKQAQQLDPSKKQEIDKVVTWLNQRSSNNSNSMH
ncbi:MAG: tetratricopeptide repeat protein [Candidatus Thiodiazotropha taylori]|nr:tetratricopeptide repeat protein [Candidatus Thiodiazotropha taylori]MCG7904896.1 tetratricopeptide repeat protein [Candidatus Thiodiazotropha taylori]MCG7926769.1 tetratricopeptide repeat protein [Candidatus Thiodiazotropha taylori]MCG7934167.1 tetratricopeptide repeat protein [Candidatus Thiodiazotropha taylori]MCG7943685.1 tetratricopeptide repeat protein [Candidatus Thiodiazotropha taylori]